MIKALAHVAINTTDLERSIRFYHETLGFPIVEDLTLENGRRLVHLQAGGQVTIELVGQPEPLASIPAAPQAGLAHLALAVDDVGAVYEVWRARGVEFTGEPRPGSGQIRRLVFCKDPDGTLIELVERAAGV